MKAHEKKIARRRAQAFEGYKERARQMAVAAVDVMLDAGYSPAELRDARLGSLVMSLAGLQADMAARLIEVLPGLLKVTDLARDVPRDLLQFVNEYGFPIGLLPRVEELTIFRLSVVEAEVELERERDAYSAWLVENGLEDLVVTVKRLGLTVHERKALEHHPVLLPGGVRVPNFGNQPAFGRQESFCYPAGTVMTDEIRQVLDACTLLSRWQAAERLGVSPETMGRLLRKAKIEPADTYVSAGNLGYLYSQSDVDRVGKLVEGKKA